MNTVSDIPWKDRWQQPQLKDPKPVLAAGFDGSFGFGQQLVLTSQVRFAAGTSERDAFAAAGAPGSPMAVISTDDRASVGFTVGQFERGHVGATGSPTTDWYRRDATQVDLHDVVGAYEDLRDVHFAANVRGLVSGDAAYLPVIRRGTVGSGASVDAVKGLTYLGGSLYAAAGITAASLEQALASAKLLSEQADHAFVVSRSKGSGAAGGSFTVSAVHDLETELIPSRKRDPDVRHTLHDLQLTPDSGAFLDELDTDVLAIIQGSTTAAPVSRHAAVGHANLG